MRKEKGRADSEALCSSRRGPGKPTPPARHLAPAALLAVLLLSPAAHAAEGAPGKLPPAATRTVSFRADVYPLLAARCFRCHRGPDASSGHRLDLRAELLGEPNGRPLV